MVGIGQQFLVDRVFMQRDFDRFAALSGDDNPIHIDAQFAAETRFGRTVAHGMLLYSAVGAVLGCHLPGPGTLQLSQTLKFPAATYAGETLSIQCRVEGLDSAGEAQISTLVKRPDGEIGLDGEACVLLPGGLFSGATDPVGEPRAEEASDPSLKGLHLGHRAELRRTFTVADLAEYADLVGDCNPLVTDSGYARRMGLTDRLIPGGLVGGLFSTLLGMHLPGPGTNYLKQRLEFARHAHPHQALTASVEIIRIRAEKQLVNLRTLCAGPSGEIICRGEALVLARDVALNR
jgi:acyl dehydratase